MPSTRLLSSRNNSAQSSRDIFPRPFAPTGSSGQPLDTLANSKMSARFGHDFSNVRIHTDARAAETADALGAAAFAHGDDIAFGVDQLTLGDPGSARLLAHELTHVVQQAKFGPGLSGRVSAAGDSAEREAAHLADRAASGERVEVASAPTAAVSRSMVGNMLDNPLAGSVEDEPFWGLNDKTDGGVGIVQGLSGIRSDAENRDRVSETLDSGKFLAGAESKMLPFAKNALRFSDAEKVDGVARGFGIGGGILSAASDFYGAAKHKDPLQAAKGIGDVATTLGQADGFSLAAEGGTVLTSGTVGELAAAGPIGAMIGAGAAGVETGMYLNDHTPVGKRDSKWTDRFSVDKMMEWSGHNPLKQAAAAPAEVAATTV